MRASAVARRESASVVVPPGMGMRRRPEGRGLAEVGVGDDQGAGPLPEQGALGEEEQGFPLEIEADHRRRPPFPAAPACGGRGRRGVSELSLSRIRATSSGKASGLGRASSRMVIRDSERRARARPSRLLSSCCSSTSRWAWWSRRFAGVVLGEHLVEQAARRLEMAGGLALPGEALEEEAGDAGDVAELALRHLGRVEARRDVLGEAGGRRAARPPAPRRAAPRSGERSSIP